jgi:pyruvate dehydrogenase E1 component alpha subunit
MSEGLSQDGDPLGLLSVLREDGRTDRTTDPFLSADTLLAIYRQMKRVRILDGRMIALQRQGRIGFYGACTGQEAPPTATAFALTPRDWVFPALRESSVMLARGFPLTKYIAQVYGSELDVLKGRQMPSHMSGREVNQVAWSSCIATQLPQAVGTAWAAKVRNDRLVTVAFLGDGATSHSDFHAALNFAGVFQVPCVMVCQNNHWSISVPVSRQTATPTLAIKARAYGLPGLRVDGNDALAVYRAVSDAVYKARSGGGPTFIECLTYRLGGHSTSDDPSRYRSEQEVAEWAARDPITRLGRHLEYLGILDEKLNQDFEGEIEAEITAAIDVVERSKPPPQSSLFDDVYASLPWHLREQKRELPKR